MFNAIIGTGIFFLPAIGAKYAGPASLLSWAIMSVVAIMISLCFAELISMFPKSGGVYEYTKNAFGEFFGFLIGWIGWIIANITIAMLVVGSFIYLFPSAPLLFHIGFSLFFILLFNFVSYRGISVSTKMLVFFGVMTILTLIILLVPGFFTSDIGNFSPFFIFPFSSIFLSTYFIAETFFGWETATYLSEEVKNPRKTLPKMMVISTISIAAIVMMLVFVSIGSLGWEKLSSADAPLSSMAEFLFGGNFAKIFALLVFIPLIGTAASWIVSSPRLLYAMSRDRVLPKSFQGIHKKYKTPHKAIIFQTAVSSVVTIIAFGNYYTLLSLLLPLAVIMYSFVVLSVVKLRIDLPHKKRSFSAPFAKEIPVLIVLFNIFLLYTWLNEVSGALPIFMLGLFFILFGIPMYIAIKLQTDEKFTEKFFDRISFFWDKSFSLWYGKKEAKKVISRLRLNKNSVVLDFGCGSGRTTKVLAEKAKTVVAVDLSKKQLESAIKKTKKLNNIIFLKEKHLRFKKNTFDAVAAVGVLEYLPYPEKKLKTVFACLKKGGTFSFLAFGKSMGMPANDFLNEEKLRKIFKHLGIKANIRKEREKLTDYWYIWGRK